MAVLVPVVVEVEVAPVRLDQARTVRLLVDLQVVAEAVPTVEPLLPVSLVVMVVTVLVELDTVSSRAAPERQELVLAALVSVRRARADLVQLITHGIIRTARVVAQSAVAQLVVQAAAPLDILALAAAEVAAVARHRAVPVALAFSSFHGLCQTWDLLPGARVSGV